MKRPPPQVNAFLVCEQAFQQAGTGKWCIIGTFDTLMASEFPFQYSGIHVFMSLGGFMGGATVEVDIRDAVGEIVMAVRGQIPEIPHSSPLSNFELALPIPPVEFMSSGSYSIELSAMDKVLAVRSLRLIEGSASLEVDPEELGEDG
ncbi:MAG: hypothetical protein QF412_03450 [Planctomycetota bacterium]|jgi:hypothetical protein|nr:hypothetical protein [Planctomycetota bacterium]